MFKFGLSSPPKKRPVMDETDNSFSTTENRSDKNLSSDEAPPSQTTILRRKTGWCHYT